MYVFQKKMLMLQAVILFYLIIIQKWILNLNLVLNKFKIYLISNLS